MLMLMLMLIVVCEQRIGHRGVFDLTLSGGGERQQLIGFCQNGIGFGQCSLFGIALRGVFKPDHVRAWCCDLDQQFRAVLSNVEFNLAVNVGVVLTEPVFRGCLRGAQGEANGQRQ